MLYLETQKCWDENKKGNKLIVNSQKRKKEY